MNIGIITLKADRIFFNRMISENTDMWDRKSLSDQYSRVVADCFHSAFINQDELDINIFKQRLSDYLESDGLVEHWKSII